ncbi:anti-sigma factor antagonist [Saccharobesus litoralis]|uniref:Anti-sigma factor antagonist n=1 Tax=Saccharobesus litoralis TaxID=2172099 RepID=A0A2S0VMC4_9ALTE|nr:STAS domain-containing protein [Saccharobesus litoralis]AWB65371.1 anti-sigma factor antagonist [Saccharobesus litoralis]
MKISTQALPQNELLISIEGEFDALGCQSTKNEWDAISTQDNQLDIVLDLSATTFLDSSGVGAIVFLFKRIRAKRGSMKICGANGQPLELLDLLRVHRAIPITSSLHH